MLVRKDTEPVGNVIDLVGDGVEFVGNSVELVEPVGKRFELLVKGIELVGKLSSSIGGWEVRLFVHELVQMKTAALVGRLPSSIPEFLAPITAICVHAMQVQIIQSTFRWIDSCFHNPSERKIPPCSTRHQEVEVLDQLVGNT